MPAAAAGAPSAPRPSAKSTANATSRRWRAPVSAIPWRGASSGPRALGRWKRGLGRGSRISTQKIWRDWGPPRRSPLDRVAHFDEGLPTADFSELKHRLPSRSPPGRGFSMSDDAWRPWWWTDRGWTPSRGGKFASPSNPYRRRCRSPGAPRCPGVGGPTKEMTLPYPDLDLLSIMFLMGFMVLT